MPGEFLDGNAMIYAFATDPRAVVVQGILERGCLASVQGPNEFANVARRKLGMIWRARSVVHSAPSALSAGASRLSHI